MATRWAYLDHPGPLPLAHRGGASDKPENTMAAFAYAVDLGYRYLETDVHATSDGVLVAFHDDDLDRVTDRAGTIRELPWEEVSKARVDGEPIPRMEELLDAWPDARFNIDMKHDTAVAPLVDVLRKTDAYDRVCVGAFSDKRLARFRNLVYDRVCTSMGPVAIARLRAASYGVPVGSVGGACSQVPVRRGPFPVADRRYVDAAHVRGIRVHIWTIDDAPEMERLLDLGVDGIMTDRPAVLKDVLIRRGQWA
ncbi:MAG TPA: glycerophosphodiester phosphodiesterase [Acidimicrobiales bacterium]|nr:glycerophosphodiester phosphodiesterase [Acidimicrobiales bacterium]